MVNTVQARLHYWLMGSSFNHFDVTISKESKFSDESHNIQICIAN